MSDIPENPLPAIRIEEYLPEENVGDLRRFLRTELTGIGPPFYAGKADRKSGRHLTRRKQSSTLLLISQFLLLSWAIAGEVEGLGRSHLVSHSIERRRCHGNDLPQGRGFDPLRYGSPR